METVRKPPKPWVSRSRRFTTSFGAGSRWRRWATEPALLLLALLASAPAEAIERRAWYYEQLVIPPAPTQPGQRRTQLILTGTSYADAMSLQVIGLLDLGPFELKAQYTERLYPLLSDIGREQESLLRDDKRSLGVEIARFYINRHRQYGRIGVEAILPFPMHRHFFKIGFAMGVTDGPSDPWAFALNMAFLIARGNNVLTAQVETRRRLSGASLAAPSFGGYLSWTYRMGTDGTPGDYEMMFFSFGPVFTWGNFRISAGIRLSLDRRVDAAGVVSNPSGVRGPDVALAFRL